MRTLVTPAEMSRIDASVAAKQRLSSFELMERVSREMADVILSKTPNAQTSFHILCGPGNNGGDGYCVARFLKEAGRKVSVEAVMPPESEDCVRASSKFLGTRQIFDKSSMRDTTVIEAIFGSQVREELPESVEASIKRLKGSRGLKIALDVATAKFNADITLVVAHPKMSFLKPQVLERLGEIVYVGRDFEMTEGPLTALEPIDFRLPSKPRSSSKKDFGRCGVIGGSSSMPGAAILAAEAASRMGAGYSSLYFSRSGSSLKLNVKDASFIYHQRWKMSDLKNETALVVGCGGRPPKEFSYSKVTVPAVLDASALSLSTAAERRLWKKSKTPLILTPHVGEAAKLLSAKTSEVLSDPFAALNELATITGQSVYLKGSPGYLRLRGDSKTYVQLVANPIFATAGSGDILSGILGGLLAQGRLPFEDAIRSGLVFQGALGEVLRGTEGVISSDQLNVFRATFERLRKP